MTGENPIPKRRGRPPKSPGDRKGGNLTFRVRDGMREELETSSKARNLSISEEIERRLGFAFDISPDPETEIIIRSVSSAIKLAQACTGYKWSKDKSTAVIVSSAISAAAKVVLSRYKDEDLLDNQTSKACKAGEAIGMRSIGSYFGLSQEEIRNIGKDDILRFNMSQEGIPDEDFETVKIVLEQRKVMREELEAYKMRSQSDANMSFGDVPEKFDVEDVKALPGRTL